MTRRNEDATKSKTEIFECSVFIKGTNPEKEDVLKFMHSIDNADGFDKIIQKESNFRNFIAADGEPLVTFDGGYGLTQMTDPPPSYEQVWNWKENLKAGISLYQNKEKEAKKYLGRNNKSFSEQQLKMETMSRWNGGAYHEFNKKTNSWDRDKNILCDSQTSNIGWNMKNPANAGATEAELHNRDKKTYSKPPKDKNWKYTGVCYADHLSQE